MNSISKKYFQFLFFSKMYCTSFGIRFFFFSSVFIYRLFSFHIHLFYSYSSPISVYFAALRNYFEHFHFNVRFFLYHLLFSRLCFVFFCTFHFFRSLQWLIFFGSFRFVLFFTFMSGKYFVRMHALSSTRKKKI